MSYLKIKAGLSTAAPTVLPVSWGQGAAGSLMPWGIFVFAFLISALQSLQLVWAYSFRAAAFRL